MALTAVGAPHGGARAETADLALRAHHAAKTDQRLSVKGAVSCRAGPANELPGVQM
jgi:hypothetical protein